MTIFWDVAPCSRVEIYRRLRGAIFLMMEAVSISETSENFCQTARRNTPEVIFILAAVESWNLTLV
jgi:hypothetical protein